MKGSLMDIKFSTISGVLFGIEFRWEDEFTAFDMCFGIFAISVIMWKTNL